jgi:glycosyltransferase involved in cell wall biosynthesis
MLTITVVIPVWNRAHTITPAIESVFGQRLALDCRLELILVDDGSTDDIAQVLQPYGDRITLIRHQRNAGAAAARNTGIAAATGDYVAFLDSDDAWLPQKIATQIAFMRDGGYCASSTAILLARKNAPAVVWPSYETGVVGLSDLVWGCFLSPGTTMICERRLFAECGVFDTTLQRHEDWDWLLRFATRYHLAHLAEPLAYREPSPHANAGQVLSALKRIRAKHAAGLSSRNRRHFEAALTLEAAAAHWRAGSRGLAIGEMAKSLWLAPFDHVAFSAVVAGRLTRR